jgi:hypothetical protein
MLRLTHERAAIGLGGASLHAAGADGLLIDGAQGFLSDEHGHHA